MKATRAFVAGAATAYLLDPRQGRRRRHVLRDRTLSVARRGLRLGSRKARLVEGRLHGLSARARHLTSSREVATDDPTVAQRIRSDALRRVGISKRDVDVAVEDGVATVRGSVESDAVADDLVGRVAKVAGVRDVAAILHVSPDDDTLPSR